MKLSAKFCVLLGVVVAASVAPARVTGPLRFAPKRGSVLKYNVVVRMTLQGAKVVMSFTETHTVTNVDSKGFVSSSAAQSPEAMTINGTKTDIPAPADEPETSVNRPDGTVASVGGKDTSPSRWRRETIQTIELPSKAIAVGASWTWVSPANSKTGAVKTKGLYKVIGSENIHGIPTWKISATVKELTGPYPSSQTGIEWISKVDATPVRCRLTQKNIPIEGIPPESTASIDVELVK